MTKLNKKTRSIYLVLFVSCLFYACAGGQPGEEVIQQEQYSQTHTAYADAAAIRYAIDHGITPDSAVVVLGKTKR